MHLLHDRLFESSILRSNQSIMGNNMVNNRASANNIFDDISKENKKVAVAPQWNKIRLNNVF